MSRILRRAWFDGVVVIIPVLHKLRIENRDAGTQAVAGSSPARITCFVAGFILHSGHPKYGGLQHLDFDNCCDQVEFFIPPF